MGLISGSFPSAADRPALDLSTDLPEPVIFAPLAHSPSSPYPLTVSQSTHAVFSLPRLEPSNFWTLVPRSLSPPVVRFEGLAGFRHLRHPSPGVVEPPHPRSGTSIHSGGTDAFVPAEHGGLDARPVAHMCFGVRSSAVGGRVLPYSAEMLLLTIWEVSEDLQARPRDRVLPFRGDAL